MSKAHRNPSLSADVPDPLVRVDIAAKEKPVHRSDQENHGKGPKRRA